VTSVDAERPARAPTWALLSRRAIALIAVATLMRLVIAAVVPLTEDEAYYRLWAVYPGLGYFDHPPMIAWWIAAGVRLFGDSALGVRTISVLGSSVLAFAVYDLCAAITRREDISFRASLWLQASLVVGIGSGLAAPDSPGAMFWALTLWAVFRWREDRGEIWWVVAGIFAALAVLSKLDGLFLAPGVLLWLASEPDGRRALRTPGPWAAVLVAFAVLLPFLMWNSAHHWLTFARQSERVLPSGFHPKFLFELPGVVLALIGPGATLFAFRGALPRVWAQPPFGSALRFLYLTSAPFALYLLIHALHDRVQANWPAPLASMLILAAAIVAEQAGDTGLWSIIRRWTAPVGLAIVALVAIHGAAPATDVFGKGDPIKQVRGWPALAREVSRARIAAGAQWIGTARYGTAAQLDFYLGRATPIVQLAQRARYSYIPVEKRPVLHGPGIIVDLPRRFDIAATQACFSDVRPLGNLYRHTGVTTTIVYNVVRVDGPRFDMIGTGCPTFEDKK
jgi:4-amino-4-deoxy-L-arabinose transferase-like glycosyltransferase